MSYETDDETEETPNHEIGKETFRSDGGAVNVTVTDPSVVKKGDPCYIEGFHGVAMGYASSGEEVSLEIAQREHEFTIASGVVGNKGMVLYIDTDGVISNDNSNRPFCKVTVAKDSNNVILAILLPQGADGY